jgi:FlaA1/EpsC-like NDP-sugar epimerase
MRNRYVLAADLPAILIAAYGAFALRFDWFFYHARSEFMVFLVAAVLLKPAIFYLFGLYSRYWMYASIPDLMAVVLAAGASELTLAAFVTIALPAHLMPQFSRAVLLIDGLLTIALTGGLRLSLRIIEESRGDWRGRKKADRNVLVVGAGQAGVMVVRELQRNRQLQLRAIGFVDDDPAKKGKRIAGVAVLGPTSAIADIARLGRADEVIIAMPTAPGAVLRSIAMSCREAGITSRVIPGVFELIDGQVSVRRLRNVDIADLLRRAQVVGPPDLATYLSGRTVLITGAGGSIGSELCRQVARARPAHLVLLGHGENSIFEAHAELRGSFPDVALKTVIADIRDRDRLGRVFALHKPDVVFHAAAHKHVPLMEDNPEEAISNNIGGTANVVDASLEAGTERFVLISSDKAVAPSNIMGASKRVAELIVRRAARTSGRAFAVVRFGNVLGSRGSVVTQFKRQIEFGGPITVTHPDMRRFFMTIPEAVHLVLQAAGISRSGELFVLDMGEPVRIVDLAKDLIRLSGFSEEEIPIVFTGMRAGEKLTEDLVDVDEVTEPTTVPNVLRVVERGRAPIDLQDALKALAAAAASGDRTEIEMALAKCIPTFAPAWIREGVRS